MDDVSNQDLRRAAEDYLEASVLEQRERGALVRMMKRRGETTIIVGNTLIGRPDTGESELYVRNILRVD